MAVTYVTVGTLATDVTNAFVDIVSPAMSVGDLMVCHILNRNAGNVISPPASNGWSEIAQGDAAGTGEMRYAAFWKIATTTGGDTFRFTKNTDDNVLFTGAISAWTGNDQSTPLDATAPAHQANTIADNVTFPAFDPTAACHVVFLAFYGNDLTTFAAAMSGDTNPDCTINYDLETSQGSDATIASTSGDSDGSAIASRTWASASTNDAVSAAIVFGIAPAAVGGGGATWPGWVNSKGGWF